MWSTVHLHGHCLHSRDASRLNCLHGAIPIAPPVSALAVFWQLRHLNLFFYDDDDDDGPPITKKDTELLEKIQHRFTCFFKDLKDMDYSECLTRLGLRSVEERWNRADLIKVFKIVNVYSALPAETFFKFKVDTQECYLNGTHLGTFDFTSSLKEWSTDGIVYRPMLQRQH